MSELRVGQLRMVRNQVYGGWDGVLLLVVKNEHSYNWTALGKGCELFIFSETFMRDCTVLVRELEE